MLKPARSRSVAILAVVLVFGGCLPGKRVDPGDLEVRNFLIEPLVAVVGGQMHTVPACSTLQLADVELRRLRIVSPMGIDLMRIDSLTGSPIGPRRFVLVDSSGVHDLRTFPNGERPRPGMDCTASVRDIERLRELRGP